MKLTTIVAAAEDQVSADMHGEAVVLNMKSGVYYGLNPLGARVWEIIQKPVTIAHIRDTILAEYDVEAARCEQDILTLLTKLADSGLVQVTDEPGA